MKKFLVFEKLQDGTYGEKLDSYESEFKDDTSANRSYLMAEPMASHFEVLAGMDGEVLRPVLVDGAWVLQIDPLLLSQKIIKSKEAAIVLMYEEMNKDVLQQMSLTFGTNNPDSASAYEKTWSMMLNSPIEWVDLGLKDDSDTPLDTPEKISAYASSKLASVLVYGKYRMQRIAQFRADKEAAMAANP